MSTPPAPGPHVQRVDRALKITVYGVASVVFFLVGPMTLCLPGDAAAWVLCVVFIALGVLALISTVWLSAAERRDEREAH